VIPASPKYLFAIHSHITLLSALAVIQHHKIVNPVLIITTNYKIPARINFNFEFHYLPEKISYLHTVPSYGNANILKLGLTILKLDSWIKKITNNLYFKLFIPHSKIFLYQVLLTHKKCLELNYIDEGLLSYTDKYHKESMGVEINIFKRLFMFNYFNRCNIHNKKKIVYNQAFRFVNTQPSQNGIKNIPWPTIRSSEIVDFSNTTILVLDNPVYGDVCKKEEYLSYLKFIANRFTAKHIFIKHHPRERDIEQITQIFNDAGVLFQIIKDDTILELSMLNSTNIQFYGGWSSLLFYASSRNHKVTSFLTRFKDIVPSAHIWLRDSLPDAFLKAKITFI
jgi:hypothetical protein